MHDLAWTPPTYLRVNRTLYRVRVGARGELELLIDDAWRTQTAFVAYDDASAQMIAENLVSRYGGSLTAR